MAFVEKDVQEKVYKALTAANKKAVALLEKQRSWEAELTGERYKTEYVQSEVDKYSAEVKTVREAVKEEVRELFSEYRAVAADAESLHAEDITDDVKLLEMELVRTQTELDNLFAQYAENYTMHKIIADYAKQRHMDVRPFIPQGMTVKEVDSLEQTVNGYLLKWVGTDRGERVLNASFGYEPGAKEDSNEGGDE